MRPVTHSGCKASVFGRQWLQAQRRRLCVTLAMLLLGIAAGCGDRDCEGTVAIAVGMINEDPFIATILEVNVRLDGEVITTFTSPGAPTNIATLATVDREKISEGSHTLVITIANQESSPNSYLSGATVQVFDDSGSIVQTIEFPEQTYTLATGDSITLDFDFICPDSVV